MISDPDDDSRPQLAENDEPVSKSQRKRTAHQITRLAAALVDLKPKVLARLPVEQHIMEAIRHCAEIKAHGARKRQLHYVGKLLRETDNVSELQTLLSQMDSKSAQPGAAPTDNPHTGFRNRLIDDFASEVNALRENYPNADLQQVRQLVRNALKEADKSAHPPDEPVSSITPHNTRAAKALLKLLTQS